MDNLDILRAREEEVGREWEWLHDVIHRVACFTSCRSRPASSASDGSSCD
jgi:hypothetical protein